MLSILIPEHNYDCSKLVGDLSKQCVQEGIPFEILVMDDASTTFLEENKTISEIAGCQFIMSSSTENLRSARIRNRLGRIAQYPFLLFLDCDLEVRDEQFIRRYLNVLGKAPVLVGAIVYQDFKPPVSHMLRWKYGRSRECLPLAIRNKNPWKSLSSQNFMMEKRVFNQVPFDESFHQYGHEDTLLGLTLMKHGFPICYIDNPLIHNGLDLNDVFLTKSLVAVEQYQTTPIMRSADVVKYVRIFQFYKKMVTCKLDGLLAFKFRLLEKCMRRNLCGAYPNLLIFDFYRLGHLCNVMQKHR